jgi:hypothetical protein
MPWCPFKPIVSDLLKRHDIGLTDNPGQGLKISLEA